MHLRRCFRDVTLTTREFSSLFSIFWLQYLKLRFRIFCDYHPLKLPVYVVKLVIVCIFRNCFFHPCVIKNTLPPAASVSVAVFCDELCILWQCVWSICISGMGKDKQLVYGGAVRIRGLSRVSLFPGYDNQASLLISRVAFTDAIRLFSFVTGDYCLSSSLYLLVQWRLHLSSCF